MTAETRIERRIVVGHRMIGVFEDDGTEQRLIANFYQPQTTVAEARENARKFLAVDDLIAALLLAEWGGIDNGDMHCPVCARSQEDGRHWENCALAAALRKARGES